MTAGAFVYPAHVVTFIEIGDDDLPITPKPVKVGHRPRTNPSAAAAAKRQYRNDRTAMERGEDIVVANPATAPSSIPVNEMADTDDLAAVVVRKTNRLLAAGKVVPTLRDGLQAQQLLDRRAEKAADRSFMLNLALALAGGGRATPQALLPPGPDPDEDIIEGTFTEENLAPAHLRQG
jgi:hypothetical protein